MKGHNMDGKARGTMVITKTCAIIIVVLVLYPFAIEPMLLGAQPTIPSNVILITTGPSRSWSGMFKASPVSLKAVFVIGGFISVGLCVVWHELAKRRRTNQPNSLRYLGTLLFLGGAIIPFLALNRYASCKAFSAPFEAAGRAVTYTGAWWIREVPHLSLFLLLACALLASGLLLYFGRKLHREDGLD